MDRFEAMRAFARVVEAGSFTKAAATLHVSRATVTELVQQLEVRLRVQLLHRTTRRVHVTPEGSAYYERVVSLLADLEDAETSITSALVAPRGRLRVDVPSPLARMLIVPALPAFHARYPDIQLHLGVSDRVVDVVGENVDCVVRAGEPTQPWLKARRVGELRAGVWAAPSYVAREGVPAHPRELENTHHRIVGFLWARTGDVVSYAMDRDAESVDVRGRYRVALDDGNAYLAAGLAGLGILWLPDYMSRAHAERGELVPVFSDWCIEPMPLYLGFPPNRHQSTRLLAFVGWIEELLARHAPLREGRTD